MSIKKALRHRLTKQTPRWFVFVIDVYFTAIAFMLAMGIIWQSEWKLGVDNSIIIAGITLLVYPFSYLFFKSYRGIIRHTGLQDIVNVLKACTLAALLLFACLNIIEVPDWKQNFLLVVIHFFITTTSLIFLRILYKRIYLQFVQPYRSVKHLLIYGAGTSGIITYNALDSESHVGNSVYAFIDDNPKLYNSRINGVKVIPPTSVTKELLIKEEIDEIIISIQNISSLDLSKIVERYEGFPVKLRIVPPVSSWIEGNLEAQQIKEVQIEDLLGRKPIRLEKATISREVEGKVVLVTGAAGSIGSEISRQLLSYSCKRLIFLDQAESDLYELQQTCMGKIKERELEVEFIIGDVRDYDRVDTVFDIFRPNIVFHAAAYKHVPLMEQNPYEAIITNIKGTKHLVDAADRYKTNKFVMISTDKAVNPTNVMGATKRVAELYVNYMTKKQSETNFVITRFGNVLGSNGSVIPLFRRQLSEGGPLTVTHPEVTRYFMTIPEACQLVLEAGAMAKGGEIYVFDMGDSMKILDLAKRMIQLSGLNYPEDIEIQICGLRPGEKIYEELLANGENTQHTHHEKIMIANVRDNNIENFELLIEKLTTLSRGTCQESFNLNLMRLVKQLVPEYLSQNSVFETIDIENKI